MLTCNTLFRCEAAGRPNNEDNGVILDLQQYGHLLAVCDGMGGMEAGEVASALAVETVKKWFAPNFLSAQSVASPMEYMKQVIVVADKNIKNYQQAHPETNGMGTTAVLLWLFNDKAYVAWCGDSRAYRFNPKTGLERLSRDHSLVQQWVDAGQITDDQAFDHPQSNIITRSLGDPNGVAIPDAAEFAVYNEDVYLLCSDGLCGTLRDREIEAVMSSCDNLNACCDTLWKADEAAGWHDNVTTALAHVVSGAAALSVASMEAMPELEVQLMAPANDPRPTPVPPATSVPKSAPTPQYAPTNSVKQPVLNTKSIAIIAAAAVAIVVSLVALVKVLHSSEDSRASEKKQLQERIHDMNEENQQLRRENERMREGAARTPNPRISQPNAEPSDPAKSSTSASQQTTSKIDSGSLNSKNEASSATGVATSKVTNTVKETMTTKPKTEESAKQDEQKQTDVKTEESSVSANTNNSNNNTTEEKE